LSPVTDFYKKLALDCSAQQIAVDMFMLNAQYADVATVGQSYSSCHCVSLLHVISYSIARVSYIGFCQLLSSIAYYIVIVIIVILSIAACYLTAGVVEIVGQAAFLLPFPSWQQNATPHAVK